jgi:hydroxyacylglutathione hydrolase
MEIELIKVGSLETNCYLVSSGDETLIIDPGQEKEKILEKIKKDVRKIVLTHYHYDHVDAAQELKTILDAQILAHRKDVSFLNFSGIGVDLVLEEGDSIKVNGLEMKVIHTPGHTEGSVCLLGHDFIFTGDTLFSDGWGRTDLPGGSAKEMKKSLKRIRELIKPGVTVYPGHGDSF